MTLRAFVAQLRAAWRATPWLHYGATLGFPVVYFVSVRLQALSALLTLNATTQERTFGHKLSGMLLGVLEDVIVTIVLVLALLVVEGLRVCAAKLPTHKLGGHRGVKFALRVLRIVGHVVRFVVVLLLTLLTLSFCSLDLLLVRAREIHFTTDLITTYWREKDQGAGTLELEPAEVTMIIHAVVAMVVVAVVFTIGYVVCVDLLLLWRDGAHREKSSQLGTQSVSSTNSDLEAATPSPNDDESEETEYKRVSDHEERSVNAGGLEDAQPVGSRRWASLPWRARVTLVVVAVVVAYVVLIAVTSAIAHAAPPVVTAIALNASLNELFRGVLGVDFVHPVGSGAIDSAAYYLNTNTESYELFRDDVLYRKTTGFQGPLAFNVSVAPENPPNVLVLAVESFRYLDSLYLAGNTTAGAVMKAHNLTVTPQFDRWARRGVAFSNMWASWQTSRSLEAILFSQVVYDSLPVSGTSRGRVDTKLVGMPQFYKQKGYETMFTTGGNTSYDQWDQFLPSHGFETVLGAVDMKRIAESDYNISKNDWWGPARRAFIWGVHDDVSYPIIGDMMIQRTKEQAARVKQGEPKKPFFWNHYSISSHFPFRAYPAWLDTQPLPDFSPLCEGWEDKCELVKRYAKLRYFADMELGKFLDRMDAARVLNDTIVVIVGDHGQSPEMGLANPVYYDTAVQHVAGALIAQGRLGSSAGSVIADAAQQNDIQNTLADIVGVPSDGFIQTGVGRSLLRQIPFGERLVWSNNPWRRMSVVRGHERFVYDGTSNRIALYDTIADPLEKHDLLPSRSSDEIAEWHARWKAGRKLSAYYKKRWDKKCLAQVEC